MHHVRVHVKFEVPVRRELESKNRRTVTTHGMRKLEWVAIEAPLAELVSERTVPMRDPFDLLTECVVNARRLTDPLHEESPTGVDEGPAVVVFEWVDGVHINHLEVERVGDPVAHSDDEGAPGVRVVEDPVVDADM